MNKYRRFLEAMLPTIRESIQRDHPDLSSHDITTRAMNEVYRLWETEEKFNLPHVYGVKLNSVQRENAGLTYALYPRETLVRFLEDHDAPLIIHVDVDGDDIYLTVDDELDGPILRDWVRYKLRGVVEVGRHYLDT